MKNNNSIVLADDVIPGHATHPGVLIMDENEYRGISQKELSEKMNISPTVLSEIIHGKRNITPSIALKLEKALGIDAEYWMRLQVKYEIDSIRIKVRNEINRTKLSTRRRKRFADKVLQHA